MFIISVMSLHPGSAYTAPLALRARLSLSVISVSETLSTFLTYCVSDVPPKKVQYDYTVHDFDSADSENTTAELDLLEYPYNQEITHRAVWAPFEDQLPVAADEQPLSGVGQQPNVAKSASPDDDSVDYPYNQDHGALLETYDFLNNGLWKEATDDGKEEKLEEDLGLIVDYPYNQLFGQEASEFPVLTGYQDNSAGSPERQRQARNASAAAPVEHTVHAVELPDVDVVDLSSAPPPRHRVYHSYPAAPATRDQQPRRAPPSADEFILPAKTRDRLMAEMNLEETRFVPVPAALVDNRGQPASTGESDMKSRAGVDEPSADGNVGRRRHELAKEGADSVEYEESFANIQMAPEDQFVFLPTGQTVVIIITRLPPIGPTHLLWDATKMFSS